MYKEYSRSIASSVIFVILVFLLTAPMVFPQTEPEKGILITLSVYSGRPNPQWWLTEGPEFDTLVRLLKELRVEDRMLFKYSKWNRLGYPTFWIISKNIDGVPYAVHIWRDEASVVQQKRGKANQAIGALPIFDMLVDQAIERKQEYFFQKYLKVRAAKEKKEKQK